MPWNNVNLKFISKNYFVCNTFIVFIKQIFEFIVVEFIIYLQFDPTVHYYKERSKLFDHSLFYNLKIVSSKSRVFV